MAKTIHPILQAFVPVVKGLAATFGSNCEVVLNDFSDLQNSIIAIENGHVTGRSIGSPMTEASLKMVVNDTIDGDTINYTGKSTDGRVLKSTTMFIRDEDGKVLGCMCLNFDISELVAARRVMNDIMKIDEDIEAKVADVNQNVVSGVLTDIVNDTISATGKPVIYLSKEEKVGIVDKLDQKGAFLIKGAIDHVAEVLCVSRYTIYNYLDEIREQK